jgi:hypothetical protein
MDRRWTDIRKWKKPFIRTLPPEYKLFWLYLCDDCDKAGIWDVDMEIARVLTGCPDLNEADALQHFGDRVKVIEDGHKWWLPRFCRAQYKRLNESYNMHKTVIEILEDYNLYTDYQAESMPEPW